METELTIATLIHRFEVGERASELLQQLDRLAWEGFHDPWEVGAEHKPVENEEAPMEEDFDPTVVHPISLATIERHLQAQGVQGWRGMGEQYLVQFRYDVEADRELRIYLSIEGKAGTLFKLRSLGDRRVERLLFPEAKAFCNDWNAGYRWPKAYLECPESEEEGEAKVLPGSGSLVLEAQYDFSAGIHQALFDELVSSNIRASWDFWNQAKERGF